MSEGEILDAAQELLDVGGADAASVRGIARKLGVAPNTIYTYFDDKAAVTEALKERLLSEVDHGVFADRNQPWRQRAAAVALELRTQLAAHPSAVGPIIGGPMSGPHALALNQRTRELFADAGLDPQDAARASYVLVAYVLGSTALEDAHAPDKDPIPPEAPPTATEDRVLPKTPTDHPPSTYEATDDLADPTSTDQYLWGLHRVLDGVTGNTTGTSPSESPSHSPRA